METENLLGGGIGLFHQSVDAEHQHARGKIGEHGLAEIFRGASAALFGQRLHLQLVFLLLQLLDDGVVEMEWQSFQSGRGGGIEIGLGGNVAAQAANHPDGKHEGATRHDQHQRSAQNQRIGQQPYHQNLPYQLKNWLPTNNASKAMLPRKTPKGI